MFWVVFTMNISVSLLMGRPPIIRPAEIEMSCFPTTHDMTVAQLDF